MPLENRADPSELDSRLLIITDLIVAGKSQAEITAICQDEHADWDVSDRTIRYYHKKAYERFTVEALGVDRRAESRLAALRLDYVYSKAIDAGRLNVARSAVIDKIRLYKLDAPGAEYSWKQALEELGISAGDSFEELVQMLGVRATDDTEES